MREGLEKKRGGREKEGEITLRFKKKKGKEKVWKVNKKERKLYGL